MIASTETFPFYEECRAKFGVDINKNVVFTYGNTIHARCYIPPDLLVHEQTHSVQQERMGKDAWWKAYLLSPAFRIKQEVEAYRNQYKYLKTNDREHNFKVLSRLASDLSGGTYGSVMTLQEAIKKIQ